MAADTRPGGAGVRPGTRPDLSTPAARRQWIVVVAVFVPILAFMGWSIFKPEKAPVVRAAREVQAEDLPGLISSADPRQMGLTGMAADMQEMRAQNAALTNEIEKLKRGNGGAPSGGSQGGADGRFQEEMRARMEALEAGERTTVAAEVGTLPQSPRSGAAPTAAVDGGSGNGDSASGTYEMETIGPTPLPTPPARPSESERTKKSIARHASRYLPRGTMISGVLLTGLDAPTGRGAQKEPVPALVRIKDTAILPNRFRADVRECFVLLAGFGSLSSERAQLRGEAFSCVRKDGSVLDVQLDVYAVGPDSKAGIRGKVVSKQGAVIGKALLAGFAQGVSQAFSRGGSYGSFGGGTGEGVDLSQIGYGGVASGGGGALEKIADYYLQQADEMYPVIEISAGIPVTLVVSKGLDLSKE